MGFDGGNSAAPVEVEEKPKPLSICEGKTPRRERAVADDASRRNTKSEELLRDFDVLRFLATADESIKVSEVPLDAATMERLDTLQAQAAIDDCDFLSDIIDHLQLENDRLRRKLDQRRYGSSASAPFYNARHLVSC